MARYILKRILRSLITMLIIIMVVFSLLRLMPVEGYFENYDKLSETQIEVRLTQLGLKDPLHVQLWNFLKQLARGDLGTSNIYRKGVSINEIVAEKMPISLRMGLISLAIAIACRPKILICDEPTTALDVTIQAQILELIKAMQKKYDLTTIYITHDLGVVANVADRIAVMYAGDIIEVGSCEEVFYDPRHPYTWALLSSLPQLGVKGEPLYSIQGTPPNLFHEVCGDAFAPRNPQALKIDFVERPPFFQVTPTHKARTWLLDPRAPKVDPPAHILQLREQGVNRRA